jgi:hypothetical protein
MTANSQPAVVIAQDDLRIVAHAALLRLPLRTAEMRRIARVRELLDVSTDLARILAAQAHTGRVHCQGSYGTGDLVSDTSALYETLAVFGALVHEIAGEYGRIVDDVPVPLLDLTMPVADAPMAPRLMVR